METMRTKRGKENEGEREGGREKRKNSLRPA